MSLRQKMSETLAIGLKRSAIKTCSAWAQNYVMMGKPHAGPMSFKYHPWTREMHDSQATRNVGQKSAQMGYTVSMINRAFYSIDFLRESVLYLLPSRIPDAADFSTTKFDPALEMSPYLARMFSDVKNMGTKRSGNAILYIRGSNSRKGLKSISVSEVIADEFDEMPEHTVPMAQERMSQQFRKQMFLISTPRFPGKGINKEFLESTMEHYFFPCPRCGKQIELKHENLVVTADDIHDPKLKESYVKCLECDGPLFDSTLNDLEYAEMKAELLRYSKWVPTGHKDFDLRGFYINQLYSPTVTPFELAQNWLRSLTNKSAEQEYHNSKMGDAHEVDGARITIGDIDECLSKTGRQEGKINNATSYIVTMGVDVGRWLHYEIDLWEIRRVGNDINIMSRCIVLETGKKADFNELDQLMRTYQVLMCVVDVQPETRQALNFAKRFQNHVKLCRYGKGLSDKALTLNTEGDSYVVSVDRTSWLDMALGRFRNRTIDLPQNTCLEYRNHLQNIARIYQEDKDGNQVGKYISNGDDHFAHARNYSEIALPLAVSLSTNTDIGAFL